MGRTSFEIWYADGAVRTGTSLHDWHAMPDEGVLVVVERFNRAYGHPPKQCGTRHAGYDYYWMTAGEEIGAGAAKYIPVGAHVKRGQEVDNETWERIYNAACVDPEVPTP